VSEEYRFRRSTDYETIRAILTEPKVYRRMADDSAPPSEDLIVGLRPGVEYILASDEKGPLAVFLLLDWADTGEVHFGFAPRAWGNTEEVCRQFLDWTWRNTSYEWLEGPLPAHNRLAMRLTRRVGFQQQAVIPNAITKNGKRYDVVVFAIKRPRS
jgi:RimJ/RimL family protein N-acetyltransferase